MNYAGIEIGGNGHRELRSYDYTPRIKSRFGALGKKT